MSSRHEVALWSACFVLALVGVMRVLNALIPAPPSAEARPARVVAPVRTISGDTLATARREVVETDPFRLSRRPSAAAYRVQLEGIPISPPIARPPKPLLALAGIVGGPPWQALIDGLPGRTGTVVVRSGESIGDLRIRSVRQDAVIVADADTTWHLTVRRAW